jgi:hypothetical protein
LAEHGGQWGQHARADETDSEKTDFAATDTAGFVEVFLYCLQGATSTDEKSLTSAGELDCSGGSGKESVAENLFKLADLLG